jgi:hypothetical protein
MSSTPVSQAISPTSTIEIPKAEPGVDIFADHPANEMKSEGRSPVQPPVAPPIPPLNAAAQNAKDAAIPVQPVQPVEGQAKPVVPDPETTALSTPGVQSTDGAESAQKLAEGPLLEEDLQADRVAEQLFDDHR